MNAERLHAIAIEVNDDLTSPNIQNTLQSLVTTLQRQINEPQNAAYQTQISSYLKTLYDSLAKSKTNDFSPAWKQAIKELGLGDLLGTPLSNRIKGIFERNQITLATAQQEIQAINKEFISAKTALEQTISSFKTLKIGAEELNPGQCEIGILVPRKAIDDKLGNFASDLEEINQNFGVFSELTTGSRPGFNIRSISSSDLTVFLGAIPVVAAGMVLAIERILALYKNILEIKKLHGELKKQGVPQKALKEVSNHANGIMQKGIEQLVKELIDKYYKKDDDGRKHELSNELTLSLNNIAKRYDNGYSIEVRVAPLIKESENSKKDDASHKDASYIKEIMAASKNIEFIKLEGDPILTLPEPDEKREDKKPEKK